MENKIFLLFACDAWKSYSTLSILMATTSQQKMDDAIVNGIRAGSFKYLGESGEKAVALFLESKSDPMIEPVQRYNNLEYAYVIITQNGEQLG